MPLVSTCSPLRLYALSVMALLAIACGPAADPPEDPSSIDYAEDDAGEEQAAAPALQQPTVVVMQCPPGTIAVQGTLPQTETVVVTDNAVITAPPGTHTVVTNGPLPKEIAARCTPIAAPAPAAKVAPAVVLPTGVHWAVRAEVLEHYGKFRRCYEKGLRRDPTLTGKVVVRMKVDSDGEVDEAHDWGSTLPDLNVVRCIVDVYEKMDFQTNVGREVVYPLEFTPSVAG